MSGVCGVVRFDGQPADAADVRRQLRAMTHRGPDGRAAWSAGPAALGRLSMRVTAQDGFEHQPLSHDPSGVTLVADLRLDNRAALGAALGLAAATLRETPDSALLLQAYLRWGDDCAAQLIGDFAFAIWDAPKRRLLLGRDHVGQRQLFYHHGQGFVAFASEIKGLWALADVPRALSEERIGFLFALDFPPNEGRTLYDGIVGVTAGCLVSFDADGAMARRSYWSPRADPAHERRDEAYYVEAYREILGEAVACRLPTNAPAGLLFSGGFDSGAIAALAGPALTGSTKLQAVASVASPGQPGRADDARPWVELCARHMPHLEVSYVTGRDLDALVGLERAYLTTDAPALTNTYMLDQAFRNLKQRGARVVMDGHGGDYTLNPRANGALAHLLRTGRLRRLATELPGHLRLSGHSMWETLRSDLAAPLAPKPLMHAWRRWRGRGAPFWGERPIDPDFARWLVGRGAVSPSLVATGAITTPSMRASLTHTLTRLMSDAQASYSVRAASLGLELTRPFHDKRVVELALAIPEQLYFKNGRNRRIARAALGRLLPPEYQARSGRNSALDPDLSSMIDRALPALTAEIERLACRPTPRRYVDLAKVRLLLERRRSTTEGAEEAARWALHGLLIARYLDWFSQENAGPE